MSNDLIVQEPAEVADLSQLTEQERARVRDITAAINIEDSQGILQYGVGVQSKISSFADTILGEIRSKDGGYAGAVLTDLSLKVKDINVDSLSQTSFFARIPLIGSLVDSVKRFIARYEKISVQIEKIVDELDKARMTLLKDIVMLDTLYKKNLDYLKELDITIIAGLIKVQELREKALPQLESAAKESSDPVQAQRMQDFKQLINRFEKKLHDLKLSRMISIQTGPQLRLIQNNNQLLVEKIQSSILNTIPLWKNQIIIAISLFRQEKALKMQKSVTQTTNDLLTKNAEMLKVGSLGVARESERGIVEIETLRKVNNDLIATIEETLKIQAEGRTKRQEAERELAKLESELKEKLTSAR